MAGRTVGRFRFNRHEFAGGVGDFGLLIPLAIALVTVNGMSATAVFGLAGVAYVATSIYFGVPFPVQPLKAFAAIAIAAELDAEVIAAGALLMSAAMTLLAATGAAAWLTRRFPTVLVRGVQASIALLLIKAGYSLAAKGNWAGMEPIAGLWSFLLAIACLGILLGLRRKSLPGSLAVLGIGMTVGLAVNGGLPDVSIGPDALKIGLPSAGVYWQALTILVVAQIPLTFGNSVVATVDAEKNYFGDRARKVTPSRVSGSIAFWNLLAGVGGGLPICHGAGGVTAHAKLGARTAGSTLMAGGLLLTLALTFGGSLPALLYMLAPGALAGMLLYVAVQHALLAAQAESLADRIIAFSMGLATLLSGNLGVGFVFGCALLGALRLSQRSRPPRMRPVKI